MSCNAGAPAIKATGLSKCYHVYDRPADRLRQLLFGGKHRYFREFWALHESDFEVGHGEILGVIGRNGAGKSTLLQLVCGTLTPTTGEIAVDGRVAALLELGAGFNPEFSGRENIFLAASIMGLTDAEIKARLDAIIEFSGIRAFIDQPVKTYSSGMYVRLAFSVATNVDPDILVIDEALSVGDGEFARKSFDRIMEFKTAGKTILFCSHSLYQVEAICSRAIWLDEGKIRAQGAVADVVRAYSNDLATASSVQAQAEGAFFRSDAAQVSGKNMARLRDLSVAVDGKVAQQLFAVSGKSDVRINVGFVSDPDLPCPSIAAGFMWQDGRVVASAATHFEEFAVARKPDGSGSVSLLFPKLPLLRGRYWASVYLLCENGVHVYDYANFVAEIEVSQDNLEQGVVSLPHIWQC